MLPTTKHRKPAAQEKKRLATILKSLYRTYGKAECALVHKNPLQLLIATILSAQCTDERVNKVTRELFRKYRTPGEYAKTSTIRLEKAIYSTGFFRSKAKHIQGACRKICADHDGNVPNSMESLVQLPGVGRKTANVVLGTWHKNPSGVVVDTHVRRISRRLGLTRNDTPEKIERDLMEALPKKDWIQFSHMVIWHGRKICTARKPGCPECPIVSVCPSAEL